MPRELPLLRLRQHGESVLISVDMPHGNLESLDPGAIDLLSLTAVLAGTCSQTILSTLVAGLGAGGAMTTFVLVAAVGKNLHGTPAPFVQNGMNMRHTRNAPFRAYYTKRKTCQEISGARDRQTRVEQLVGKAPDSLHRRQDRILLHSSSTAS